MNTTAPTRQPAQTIAQLIGSNALENATRQAVEAVKANPDDAGARGQLAELCLLSGDLERADTHAKMAGRLDPGQTVGFGIFRQYLRGLHARAAWWESGALPEFPMGQTLADEAALKLNVALRAGDGAAARAALEEVEALRGTAPAVWNGREVADLRDLDDRLPHALEAVTQGGNYLWIDFSRIAQVEFEAPRRPVDLACRKARLSLRDGSAADLLLPAIYPGAAIPTHQLARQTDFSDGPEGLCFAHGQRAFLAGEEVVGLLDAQTLVFTGDAALPGNAP